MAKHRISARLLKAIEARTLLLHVVSGDKLSAVLLALYNVESYLRGATNQQARIQRAQRHLRRELEQMRHVSANPGAAAPWRGPVRKSRGGTLSSLFRDIHFYLICWNIVGRDLTLVRHITGFPALRQALRPYVTVFQEYKKMRDHYEHFDERLPGRARSNRLKRKNDLGNLAGNTLSFGGDQIDVGPKSLKRLRQGANDVLLALKVDALRIIAEQNPQAAKRILQTAQRDRMTKRLIRSMRLWDGRIGAANTAAESTAKEEYDSTATR
ncbi:MAG: hypothetical protein HY695_03025 [Deltaproteobacteria bacterium]|nr:hypothetical protein [Deltaproteobacteria bacterium]